MNRLRFADPTVLQDTNESIDRLSNCSLRAWVRMGVLALLALTSVAHAQTGVTPAPIFSLAGGTYHSPQTLTLTDSLPGATIYYTYTTNGVAPTISSAVYGGPITINATGIVEAIATAPGNTPSHASSKAYVYAPLPAAAAPYFNLAGGTYHSPQLLTLTDTTPGATIHYTTNGTAPTAASTLYAGPITIASTETVEAAAIATGFSLSPPSAKSYTYVPFPAAAAPSFSLAGGTYNTPHLLTLTDATPGATIYYTTNGISPTTASTVYAGPITIASTETVKAAAIAAGYSLSPVSAKAYTYNPLPPATAPFFSLAGGHYTTPQMLMLTDSTAGATIYYTTNGTMPTTASTKYTGPLTINTTETVIAIATASGYTNSNPASKAYVIPTTALTVEVSVTATDSGGLPLTYRWKSTDGVIQDVNASSTSWILPNGPGLHFAYVLVSNGAGGYTERRVAVNTDTIGTAFTIPPPLSLAPPPASAPAGDFYRATVNDDSYFPVPDIPVYLLDDSTGTRYPTTGTVLTDLKGEFVVPGVPPLINYSAHCSVDGGNTTFDCTSGNTYTSSNWPPPPLPSVAVTDYGVNGIGYPAISGSLLLQDGSPCGTANEFFGVRVTATATLLDASGSRLAGPVRLNEFGDYSFPFNANAASVLLNCENATPLTASINSQSTLTGVSAPTVLSMSAIYNGSQVGIFLPPPSGLPSDPYPRADQFLVEKGLDSRLGSCLYYKSIGAAASCDASGNPTGAISFEDWKRTVKIDNYASGAPVYAATYVNKVDLNLTRNHHSVSYGVDQTAAYVCNHLGPPTLNSPQSDIDTAVDNAVSGKNLVACVAMDIRITPGLNVDIYGVAQPFTRFLIFGPSGQLLPSINLDGRREKFVPGTCVVCHGGDHYAGKFPEDGTGKADVGGHFLPYDNGNFEFSSKPGSTEADQEQAIYLLNQNLLYAAPTVAEQELIAGWYAAGPVLDKKYLPASWQGQSGDALSFYQNVLARSCRTCHVALVEGYNFDHYQNITPNGPFYRENDPSASLGISVCDGGSPNQILRAHSMPNSRVTFDRFWQSAGTAVDQPAILTQFFAGNVDACTPGATP